MDIFDKVTSKRGNLGQYAKQAHGYFAFPKLEGEIGSRMKFRGKEVLTWSLNNYIGLANHPEVRKEDAEAAARWGLAYPMGARMMSGQTSRHEELEAQLADFVGKPDAFLLNFGYQGMVSIIDAMVGRHDVIVYDSESHACIMDGLRLHVGKRFVYPHNDMDNLRKELDRATKWTEKTGGGILVITEGVFGMAGDLGKLDEICALKDDFNFRLLVDDAHGFGVMGKTGAGTIEHFGVEDKVDLHFSTFAKAMAGIGAFIACSEEVGTYLRYTMRSQIFAKSLPMPIVEGSIKRLELLKNSPELREKLWNVTNALQTGLTKAGLNIGVTESPVTPVYLSGSVAEGTQVTMDLRENYNIFCSIVVYPVIPKGQLLLRLIPTAIHTIEDVEYTVNAFKEVAKKLKDGKYSNEKFADIFNQ
ncbi:aminotransferase class I/II-fold pyridoxal phosphate-dependent enzyme [Labilibaculum sp. A4]|uniref:Aminotransferase class I/II-fold pyridoxal phosphate-dependent enzyme n=1 Tax=Labilibaculum euxinus TaxID=2686357 RepID=A0A425YGV1_9BACT|nr:aminotransferase class I/II-fold pyridoxal phosphate-dependent enzyme [Labilibaculum euxinus]MDQ1769441.1 aminotransferase class I/II-fold pyridoxal phosphate-dependent enzyme [Labilibaculum euxinus]MUP36417.1 aminotransferase class I/II-fold pyridoxal phosphate-dependent enzyme [Labilibaculum euxinus]MVB05622.1 aminotransferase class I/II-fold pyridoxal phosphate-dependent enzyme [Labilibaculum euxinus]MWN74965.1 aminotransferase class I/II-fold pyridoxal phosphate-dependent enzyme [Labilib